MKKEIESSLKKKRNILKGIGILEIIGGVTGISLIFWFLFQGLEINYYSSIILLIAVIFYSYSIYAGIILFKKTEKGITHSWIIQFIQILGISYNGITYLLTSGGNLLLGYNFTEGDLNFSFGIIASEFDLSISPEFNNFIQINIMAIIILYFLDKSVKSINEQSKLLSYNLEEIGK